MWRPLALSCLPRPSLLGWDGDDLVYGQESAHCGVCLGLPQAGGVVDLSDFDPLRWRVGIRVDHVGVEGPLTLSTIDAHGVPSVDFDAIQLDGGVLDSVHDDSVAHATTAPAGAVIVGECSGIFTSPDCPSSEFLRPAMYMLVLEALG